MRPSVIAVYNSNGFQKAIPHVFISGNWVPCIPYVYNGSWQQVGIMGTLMIALKDSDGNDLHTTNNELLLVKQD